MKSKFCKNFTIVFISSFALISAQSAIAKEWGSPVTMKIAICNEINPDAYPDPAMANLTYTISDLPANEIIMRNTAHGQAIEPATCEYITFRSVEGLQANLSAHITLMQDGQTLFYGTLGYNIINSTWSNNITIMSNKSLNSHTTLETFGHIIGSYRITAVNY